MIVVALHVSVETLARLFQLADADAHLDGDAYATDLDEVLERAHDAGVSHIVTAGQDEATSRATFRRHLSDSGGSMWHRKSLATTRSC